MGYNLTQINPAYTLVADTIVGTATTTVDLTGLNITKDDDYMLVSDIYATNISDVKMYFNANYTVTNYYNQEMYASSTTVGGSRGNFPQFSYLGGISYKTQSFTNIKLTNNGYVVYQSKTVQNYGGSSVVVDNYAGTSTFTATSITSIRVLCSQNMASGSRFQLYKRTAPVIADITVSSATTSVDITGLSIDKGSEYMLVSTLVNASGSNSNYMLYANTTLSGYYTQYLYGAGTAVGAVRTGDTLFGNAYTGSSSFEITNIKLTNNGYVISQTNELMRYTSGSQIELMNRAITTTFTSTTITSLRITSSVASGIGIGSRFQLIKLK